MTHERVSSTLGFFFFIERRFSAIIKKLLGVVAVLAAIILIGSIDSIVDAVESAGYLWVIGVFDCVAAVYFVRKISKWAK